ncbi:MAG: MurT ligase domain-containing protein [Lactimicrobium sp.]|uniref:MurT ligase domain-containing protein n=1 Tax=Lactimicrobium sp. TaxID=2563780 RepID=UPI002F353EEF
MDMRLALVKGVSSLLKKAGRGGSFPGTLALKMDHDFIARFQMPKIVILVTGTNGKTTTQNLIAQSLRASGLKVINNARGDNLNVGIASLLAANSDMHYHVQADAAVIEVDELTLYRQFANLHPTALVVTNFFRDQLDRAGEMETIIRKIMDVTKDFTQDLILNGNDPNVLRIGLNAEKARKHYFAVDRCSLSQEKTNEASEGKFCPICGNRLHYEYYQYSHIGKFWCPNDGFGKVPYDIEVTDIDFQNGTFTADGHSYKSFVNTIYGVYNCAAVLTVMKVYGIDSSFANKVFGSFVMKEGRNELFRLSKPCIINLAKNPTGTNEVLKYILNRPGDKNVLILLNDNDQDGHDVSWIWDAHFERLNVPEVKTIVCSGTRAYDMALRLKYEGLEDRIHVEESAEKAVKWLDDANLDSYVISTYTALHSTRALLAKEAQKWN